MRKNEEIRELITRLAMDAVAEEQGRAYLEQAKRLDETQPVTQEQRQKRLTRSRMRSIRRKLTYAASVLLVCTGILLATGLSVCALRFQISQLVTQVQNTFSTFELLLEESQFEAAGHTAYRPTYVPAGYMLTGRVDTRFHFTLSYTDKEGNEIGFIQKDDTANFDTEDVSGYQTVDVNGHLGKYFSKKDRHSLCWSMDGYLFNLSSNQEDLSGLLKMAGGVSP